MATWFRLEGLFDRLVFQRPSTIAALAGLRFNLYSQHEESNL